jgi:hypothetical protein
MPSLALSVYRNRADLTTNLFSGRSEWNIRASHQTKKPAQPNLTDLQIRRHFGCRSAVVIELQSAQTGLPAFD